MLLGESRIGFDLVPVRLLPVVSLGDLRVFSLKKSATALGMEMHDVAQ